MMGKVLGERRLTRARLGSGTLNCGTIRHDEVALWDSALEPVQAAPMTSSPTLANTSAVSGFVAIHAAYSICFSGIESREGLDEDD